MTGPRDLAAAIELLDLKRDGHLGPEFERLVEGARRQFHAVDAGGEAEIVFDAGGRARLSAEGAGVEHEHRQTFRGGIHGGGKSSGPRADHGDVVQFVGIEIRRDAETGAGLRIGRTPQHLTVRAEHHRKLVVGDHGAVEQGLGLGVLGGIQHRVGIAVAAEKALDAREIRRAGRADKRRAGAAIVDQPDPAQDEGAHHDLADFGRADHQRADMRIVERNRGRAVSAGPAHGERLAPGELAQFAGELATMVGGDEHFVAVAVAAERVDGALEHEPGRCIPLADVEHGFAWREVARRTAGEALRRLDLLFFEHGKYLMTARLGDAHGWLLLLSRQISTRETGNAASRPKAAARAAQKLASNAAKRRSSSHCCFAFSLVPRNAAHDEDG